MQQDEQQDAQQADGAGPAWSLAALRAWAGENRRRNLLVGGLLAGAAVLTTAMWLAAASIAVETNEDAVARALQALDDGEDELARSIVAELQTRSDLSAKDFGGALFVLGTLKSREAERQWSPDRARTDHYIASRYLEEGRAIGFPGGRVGEGLYLLGKSLIESRRLDEGAEVLREAIRTGLDREARAHLLLAEAYFYAPRPDYPEALREVEVAIADGSLDPILLARAELLRAETLAAMGRGVEALDAARQAGGEADAGRRALAEGKALIAQIENAAGPERLELGGEAEAALARARKADKLATAVTRQSDFLRARVAELVGRRGEALRGYEEVWRNEGATEPGIAAAYAEARLLQEDDRDKEALDAYRRGLDAISDPTIYRSALLPLSEVRLRLRTAHARFLQEGRYETALELTEHVSHLLGQGETIAMRANTLKRWGEAEIEAARRLAPRGDERLHAGRRHLREAGIAYEQLAESRYATDQFSEDLWTAVETLLQGQAYAEMIRVLDRYVRHEPVKRNAMALLRTGEAHLARGEHESAIRSLEECLEFHEDDAASFRARLDCAKAYRMIGDLDTAEGLLRTNLTRTALTPASPEWRDSKFELGRLLAEADRHEEAIRELQEAVTRYPEDPQSPQARYNIAMAQRAAAKEPLERLRAAKTVSEREAARAEAETHLLAALEMFKEVQNELIRSASDDLLDRVTLRNCFMLGGDVLFELGRYDEARQAFSNVATLYQNEPFMLEAFVHIYHCWRRENDRPKALGVVQQARLLLDRLPPDADFATSTNLTGPEWDALLTQLATF